MVFRRWPPSLPADFPPDADDVPGSPAGTEFVGCRVVSQQVKSLPAYPDGVALVAPYSDCSLFHSGRGFFKPSLQIRSTASRMRSPGTVSAIRT